ncbi:MAG: DegT/DnrJ/EryC1/StrS family aminotransferase, partial [Lachnospiraceae bacterium]
GGMLLSNDETAIQKVRFWSTQSRENERHYEHKELGYNYRMSNIVAGIGRGQLKVLDQRVKKKTQIFETYQKAFETIDAIE